MKVGYFDLEADGFLDEATRCWCIVIKDKETGVVQQFTPDQIREGLTALSNFDVLIGHNIIMYDFPLLRKLYGYEFRGDKVDTLVMSRTQRPMRSNPPGYKGWAPNSLEAWGHAVGRAKPGHDEWDKFSPEMLHRCTEDVHVTELVYEELLREGAGEGWTKAHRLNFKLWHYLQLQEEFGWRVDQDHMHNCVRTLTRWMDKIDATVIPLLPPVFEAKGQKKLGVFDGYKKPFKKNGDVIKAIADYCSDTGMDPSTVGGPFVRVLSRDADLDANVEVKNVLLRQGWEPMEWNVDKDGNKTSPKLSKNEEWEGVEGGIGRLIARRVQCKQRRGTIEGWFKLIREDGRISARVAGIATTGRLRHSGIVNVPSPHSDAFFARQMRQVFIARPGWKMVGVDSKGNQVRQLAARMKDDEFTQAVLHGSSKDGTDFHSVNQRKTGAPSRSRAKNFYYGLVFGGGDTTLGKVVDGTAQDGKRLREEYYEDTPGLKILIEESTATFRETAQRWYNKKWDRMEYRNGYIKGLDGRPILVDSEHKILVYYLQSDEAIQMAGAYVKYHKDLEARGYIYGRDFGTCIWMHDEFQVECRAEIAEEVGEVMAESIAWAGRWFEIQVPHEGDIIIGDSWYDTH
jgi:hypothetical protein